MYTHNIPYTTFKRKYIDYKQANSKENWSPNSKRRYRHRVFTDSTEKAAVKQLTEQYISKQKACNNGDNSTNPITTNITNNIHIHVPDIDKHGNSYTTTKDGSMTQERFLNFINQVIIKHTDGAPAALFLDAASISRSDATRDATNYVTRTTSLLSQFHLILLHGYNHVMC